MIDGGVGNRRKEDEDGGSEHAYDAGRRRARLPAGCPCCFILWVLPCTAPERPHHKKTTYSRMVYIYIHMYIHTYM